MARLDRHYRDGHWEPFIEVATLRLNSPEHCPLAQLFCGYENGKKVLGLQECGENSPAALGFALFVPPSITSKEALLQYAILTEVWREEILLRREGKLVPLPRLSGDVDEPLERIEDAELVCV